MYEIHKTLSLLNKNNFRIVPDLFYHKIYTFEEFQKSIVCQKCNLTTKNIVSADDDIFEISLAIISKENGKEVSSLIGTQDGSLIPTNLMVDIIIKLYTLHSNHYIHNDLHLSNILHNNNTAIILDFGACTKSPYLDLTQNFKDNIKFKIGHMFIMEFKNIRIILSLGCAFS